MVSLSYFLWNPEPAHAHRLNVDCSVEPGGQVRVWLFFASGGPASGAKVRLLNEAGQLISETETDAEGTCVFRVSRPQAFKAEGFISGHRGVYAFRPRDVEALRASLSEAGGPASALPPGQASPAESRPAMRPESAFPSAGSGAGTGLATGLIAGLGFILALASLAMVMSQRKAIRALEERLAEREEEKP